MRRGLTTSMWGKKTPTHLSSVNLKDYMTIAETAAFLGYKEEYIHLLLCVGVFTKYKLKRMTLVRRVEIKDYKRKPGWWVERGAK